MSYKGAPYLKLYPGDPKTITFDWIGPKCVYDTEAGGYTKEPAINRNGQVEWIVLHEGEKRKLTMDPDQSQAVKSLFKKGDTVSVNIPAKGARLEFSDANCKSVKSTMEAIEEHLGGVEVEYTPSQEDLRAMDGEAPSQHQVSTKYAPKKKEDNQYSDLNRHKCLASALNVIVQHPTFKDCTEVEIVEAGKRMGGEFFLCVEGGFPIEEMDIKNKYIDIILGMFSPETKDDFVDMETEVNDILLSTSEERIDLKEFDIKEARTLLSELSIETLQLIDRTRAKGHM